MIRPLSMAPRLKAISTAHRWRTPRQLPSASAVPSWVVVPVTWLTARCSKPRKPTAFTMPAIPARVIAPTQTQRGSRVFMPLGGAPGASGRLPEAHATPPARAGLVLADQFDAGRVERADHLGQGTDHSAHGAFAGFHALDRGQGHACQRGQLALVDAEQGAGGPHLGSGDHGCNGPPPAMPMQAWGLPGDVPCITWSLPGAGRKGVAGRPAPPSPLPGERGGSEHLGGEIGQARALAAAQGDVGAV